MSAALLALVAEQANCAQVDLDLFFPINGGTAEPAKKVCRRCPVQTECLQYALDSPVDGIWGGTSVQERRALAVAAGRSYNTVVTPRLLRRSA
jgi:WhiB family redox-sensing transcriptional regulator